MTVASGLASHIRIGLVARRLNSGVRRTDPIPTSTAHRARSANQRTCLHAGSPVLLPARQRRVDWRIDRTESSSSPRMECPLHACSPRGPSRPAASPGRRTGPVSPLRSARHDTWDLDLAVDIWTVASDRPGEPERLTDTVAEYTALLVAGRLPYRLVRSPTPFDEPRHGQLGVIDLASRRKVEWRPNSTGTASLTLRLARPVWMGDHLLFASRTKGTSRHVYSVAADGDGKPQLLVERRTVGRRLGLGR